MNDIMYYLLPFTGVAALFTCALALFVTSRAVSLLTRQAGALYLELQRFRQLVEFFMRTMSTAAKEQQPKAPDSDDSQ